MYRINKFRQHETHRAIPLSVFSKQSTFYIQHTDFRSIQCLKECLFGYIEMEKNSIDVQYIYLRRYIHTHTRSHKYIDTDTVLKTSYHVVSTCRVQVLKAPSFNLGQRKCPDEQFLMWKVSYKSFHSIGIVHSVFITETRRIYFVSYSIPISDEGNNFGR